MSSPVHHPNNLDPSLMYAPPWARGFMRRRAGDTAGGSGDDDDNVEPTFDGDRAVIELRRRLSLDPEAVPVPPQFEDGIPIERIAMRLCAIACVGAVIAWVLSATMSAKPIPSMATSSSDEPAVANTVPVFAAKAVKLVHLQNPADEGPTSTVMLASADTFAVPVPRVTAALPQPDAAVTAPSSSSVPAEVAVAPALGQEEIAQLLERGKAYLVDGNIAQARLLLRRAAEAGSAEAALALGSTFDPRVIARLGAVGVSSDPQKARQWYEKAAQLGSTIAPQQLGLLANQDR